jgi:hypothetical protein
VLGPALFPISLSNQAFGTEAVLPMLQHLLSRHDEVIFLIADQLQVYNKALRLQDGVPLKEIVSNFGDQTYLNQRNRWVSRLLQKMPDRLEDLRWRVLGVDNIADNRCFSIFRNVMLAYYGVKEFRSDIQAAAKLHAMARGDRFPLLHRELLSTGYLLEEIALSIRIHVLEEIDYEYYLGDQSLPIIKLYSEKYEFSPFDLAELPNTERKIRLFGPTNGSLIREWKEILPGELAAT